MRDQRLEPRKPQAQLPSVFDQITVHLGSGSFTCKAIDAGPHGLGLLADGAHKGKLNVGSMVRVEIGSILLDAEVLNVFEGMGKKAFRFGVFLPKERQLGPYQRLLKEDRYAYLLG
jgi:hypothetical protein